MAARLAALESTQPSEPPKHVAGVAKRGSSCEMAKKFEASSAVSAATTAGAQGSNVLRNPHVLRFCCCPMIVPPCLFCAGAT